MLEKPGLAVGDDPRVVGTGNDGRWALVPMVAPENYDDANVGVCGTSMRNFFVARYYGDVAHFDGTHWNLLPRVLCNNVLGIAEESNGDVFVSATGLVVRYHPRQPAGVLP